MNKCRWSPTLGELEDTHQEIWKTENYNPDTDKDIPTIFFGVYGLPDFMAVRQHRGKKWILWAGSDILHLENGYWIDDVGNIKVNPKSFCEYLNKYCENWCENIVERDRLRKLGISARVCPSFLGNVNKFKVTYKWSLRPKVYTSVSGNNFKQYGWDVIERIAGECEVDFYLYGNTKEWKSKHKNVFIRGRVSKEIMNAEIEEMQCGFRPLEFDGFSEVLAKAILIGQYPISRIKYPHIWSYSYPEQEKHNVFADQTYSNIKKDDIGEGDKHLIKQFNKLKCQKQPNLKARNYYLQKLNKYPWVK